MDNSIERNIQDLIVKLKREGTYLEEPVARLMLSALIHQAEKVSDEIESLPDKISNRLCDLFIPRNRLSAVPAMVLIQTFIKQKKDVAPKHVSDSAVFAYKVDNMKQPLNYQPLFANLVIPYNGSHILTPHVLKSNGQVVGHLSGHRGQVWLGLEMDSEVDCLGGVSLFIKGTGGLAPRHIYAASGMKELSFSTMEVLEDIPMLEPFDSQQTSKEFVAMVSDWKDALLDMDDAGLLYISDYERDRDSFKLRSFPKSFQQTLESNDLDRFSPNTLWLLLDFGDAYEVSDNVDVMVNVMPVVNVNVNNVTLTQSAPLAKLTKGDGSFYVSLLETSTAMRKQGFGTLRDEVMVRDFDAACYNNESLFSAVRTLYNHFIDDYYTFLDYNGIKDGESIRLLRETINNLGKGVYASHDKMDRFDSGVFVMKNTNMANQSTSVKVSYLTTMGRIGNMPLAGQKMDNRKEPAFEKDAVVVVPGMCGEDRPNADARYELLRYYTLTEDRLYTKMDIDAFLRKEIIREFGKEETSRISFNISVEGAAGDKGLRRGLYIDIMFKDNKNYERARSLSLDRKFRQRIVNKSCIAMPIFVSLKNLER